MVADPYLFPKLTPGNGSVTYLESTGSYAVSGFDEVYEVHTDIETYSSAGGLGPKDIPQEEARRPPSILESDPPIHTLMRRALTGVINLSTVRALREPFTGPAVDLIGGLADRSSLDVVKDVAVKDPIKVFPDAVGIPEHGLEHLLPYGNLVFNAFGPENYIFQLGLRQQ